MLKNMHNMQYTVIALGSPSKSFFVKVQYGQVVFENIITLFVCIWLSINVWILLTSDDEVDPIAIEWRLWSADVKQKEQNMNNFNN